MIIGITGHRHISFENSSRENYNFVYKAIENYFVEYKPNYIITGMAIGVDQIAAMIAYRNSIPFVAALPFKNQEKYFSSEQKEVYNEILSYAKDIIYVSEENFSKSLYQKRNEYIVNNCDLLLAVCDGKPSGTLNCVNFALKINKKVIIIKPREDVESK